VRASGPNVVRVLMLDEEGQEQVLLDLDQEESADIFAEAQARGNIPLIFEMTGEGTDAFELRYEQQRAMPPELIIAQGLERPVVSPTPDPSNAPLDIPLAADGTGGTPVTLTGQNLQDVDSVSFFWPGLQMPHPPPGAPVPPWPPRLPPESDVTPNTAGTRVDFNMPDRQWFIDNVLVDPAGKTIWLFVIEKLPPEGGGLQSIQPAYFQVTQ